jgi:methylated-DNA-[protein]-cysteine S-methyltransferase
MTDLARRCYVLLSTVPKGKVTTYKALADALGTKSYRAVGQFMRHNPYAPTVPCHRVVASDGRIGGFKGKSTGLTIDEKIRMLKDEGVEVEDGMIKNFGQVLYTFPKKG